MEFSQRLEIAFALSVEHDDNCHCDSNSDSDTLSGADDDITMCENCEVKEEIHEPLQEIVEVLQSHEIDIDFEFLRWDCSCQFCELCNCRASRLMKCKKCDIRICKKCFAAH